MSLGLQAQGVLAACSGYVEADLLSRIDFRLSQGMPGKYGRFNGFGRVRGRRDQDRLGFASADRNIPYMILVQVCAVIHYSNPITQVRNTEKD